MHTQSVAHTNSGGLAEALKKKKNLGLYLKSVLYSEDNRSYWGVGLHLETGMYATF